MNEPQMTLTTEEFENLLRRLLEEELKSPQIEERRLRKRSREEDVSRKMDRIIGPLNKLQQPIG
ncbi:MAG TPA: hypothetical protein VE999_21120 [Gemmataceae bacterium]|nr:hypothetical protein [Gemmataceae bacterium]